MRLLKKKIFKNQLTAYHRKKKRPKKRTKKNLLGRLLIFSGLSFAFFLLSPFLFMEIRYHLRQLVYQEPEQVSGFGKILKDIQEESGFAGIIKKSDLALLSPVDANFSIVIPKISVNSRVFANIPTDDKEIWQSALKDGVAHAKGSYLPGQEGTVYLFGHSTDYLWNVQRFNATFYLLKELKSGDQVNLFYQGDRFAYEVSQTKVLRSGQVSEINESLSEDRLILQTCWPPGTNWKRLLVIARPI